MPPLLSPGRFPNCQAMLTIARYESLAACAPLRDQMDALNLRARRPCPYSTLAYYENFLVNDEFLVEGRDARLLFLAVLDDDRLVGYAALRRRRTIQLGGAPAKIEWLVTRDTDRPHLVCAPEDGDRCARTIVGHLVHDEPPWTYLELADQEDDDPLVRALRALAGGRFVVRGYEGHANSTLDVHWTDGAAYFRCLSRKTRETVSHQVRKLMASGRVELVRSTSPSGGRALLPAYLAVEARSWKHAAGVGIGRHPKRVAFYEGLFDDAQPMHVAISLLVLDGTPVAGMVHGTFGDTLYLIEIAYDGRFERVSPGQALQFFAMMHAVDSGHARVNMRSDSAWWKSQWLATVSSTAHVRVLRRPSLPWARAIAGALRRRVRGDEQVAWNPLRRLVRERTANTPWPASGVETDSRAVLAAVLAHGAQVERMDHESIESRLPFGAGRGRRPARR